MQENENFSETEPTATDETAGGDLESAALEQHETADLHRSKEDDSHDKTASLESTELVEEDEDDGPVELDDPFSGSENAKPVMLDGEEDEAEEATPVEGDMDWYILKVQSNREDSIRETLQRRIAMQVWIRGLVKSWFRRNKSLNSRVERNGLSGENSILATFL